MFTMMLCAGLRVGEVVTLKLENLQPVADLPLTRLRVCGKGDKERIVWLTAQAMAEITQWLQDRPWAANSYLFLNQHGRPLSVAGIQYRLQEYCGREGLNRLVISCATPLHDGWPNRKCLSIVWPSCWVTQTYRPRNAILMGQTLVYVWIFCVRWHNTRRRSHQSQNSLPSSQLHCRQPRSSASRQNCWRQWRIWRATCPNGCNPCCVPTRYAAFRALAWFTACEDSAAYALQYPVPHLSVVDPQSPFL